MLDANGQLLLIRIVEGWTAFGFLVIKLTYYGAELEPYFTVYTNKNCISVIYNFVVLYLFIYLTCYSLQWSCVDSI